MDGYTKAAIKEALANLSPREVSLDALMDRMINGPVVYVFTALFLLVLRLGDLGNAEYTLTPIYISVCKLFEIGFQNATWVCLNLCNNVVNTL